MNLAHYQTHPAPSLPVSIKSALRLRLARYLFLLICAFFTIATSATAAAPKSLLYGPINDAWLADTISRWANSGFSGFMITNYVQWFTPAAELETHRAHFTDLNRKGAPYGITDNFFVIQLSSPNFNDGSTLPAWQDDAGWNKLLATTITDIAKFALTTGTKGIVFDTEQYTAKLWNIADPRNGGLSQAALKPLVYKRGQQLMQTLKAAYPGIQIILLQEGASLATVYAAPEYQLWPDFYNGLASSQPQPAIIVGSEMTYPEDVLMPSMLSNPDAFVRNYAAEMQSAMAWATEYPAYWQQQGSLAIGMRPLGAGTSYNDKSARYSPDVFKAQLNAAKAVSGKYVWVYSHGTAWWQMTQSEVDTYSNNPWHYTPQKDTQIKPTDRNIQAYFSVINETVPSTPLKQKASRPRSR